MLDLQRTDKCANRTFTHRTVLSIGDLLKSKDANVFLAWTISYLVKM